MEFINNVFHNPRSAVTVGAFDGLHLGHLQIINELTSYSRANGLRSVVISFHPHPQEVLKTKENSVELLSTKEEREIRLKALGVDEVQWIHFSPELANTTWVDFCDFIQSKIGFSHIVFGHDHAFGKNREGNYENLSEYGKIRGFTVSKVAPFLLNNEPVSSSKIRKALFTNEIKRANDMLGYNYSLVGKVVKGDGRGRQIGLPTANILPLHTNKIVPANGVYGVDIQIQYPNSDNLWSKPYRAMMNIGVRPTFTLSVDKTLEAHIFDFDKDIYSLVVKVEFLIFARLEQKFASKDEFLAQLARDAILCKAYK